MKEKLRPYFSEDWFNRIEDLLDSPYVDQLFKYLKKRKLSGAKIYPEQKNIFRVFNECSYDDIRVVILGQD